ncbi:MAG: hypothetical protein U5N58_07200 [Actinomycetota bacterium]|nr:hypothetical protein [Actinomycetota bacterium]
MFENIKQFLEDRQFDTFFALGSGFDYGIAGDLKEKEMSQTNAYSYHLHEFNHGPKTLVTMKVWC